jgi:hypothetical protein
LNQLLTVFGLVLGMVACGGQAEPAAPLPEPEDVAAVESPGLGEQPVDPAAEPTPEGMIASGTAELGPTTTPPTRPTQPGVQRAVTLADAVDAVPFPVFEPTDLPEESYRDVVQLIEPYEGVPNPALPAVRFIYTLGSGDTAGQGGTLVVYQSPATGEPPEGEETTVGGQPAWLNAAGEATVLAWEREGTRIELRGNGVVQEVLLAAAESMAPAAEDAEAVQP